jgi:hypothetical protein
VANASQTDCLADFGVSENFSSFGDFDDFDRLAAFRSAAGSTAGAAFGLGAISGYGFAGSAR